MSPSFHLDQKPVTDVAYQLYRAKRYQEALAAYDAILAQDPLNIWAHFRKGLALREQNRYVEALAAYERAIGIDPAFPWSFLQQGHIFQTLERYEEALMAYERALELQPDSWSGQFELAWVLRKLQRSQEALLIYAQLPQDSAFTDMPVLAAQGETLWELHRYEQALMSYKRLIAMDFDDAWRFIHPSILNRQPLEREELAAYERLMDGDGNLAGVYSIQGEVLQALGRSEEAKAAYEQALKLCEALLETKQSHYAVYLQGIILNHWQRVGYSTSSAEKPLERVDPREHS